eukprot:Em0009g603a
MHLQSYKEILQNELIPSDLLLHLQAKAISVFWIDTTCLHNSTQHLECTKDCIGTSLVASVMSSSGGRLIPIEGILHGCSMARSTDSDKSRNTMTSFGSQIATFSAVLNLGNYILTNLSLASNKAPSQFDEACTSGRRESSLVHATQFGDPFNGVLLSLIKQGEFPLHWLDPSKIYFCSSSCNLSVIGNLPKSLNQMTSNRTPEVHISGHLHHALVVELPANVGATGQTDFGTAQNGCEDLFIWLARNRMLLLLGVRSLLTEGRMSLAVLQPLTPSRATLSGIDPSFHSHIMHCLSQLCAVDYSSLVECITKSLTVESSSNISPCDPLLQRRSSLPVNLLGCFHSQSLSSLDIEVSPFLDLNLISWHSYLPMCGVSRNTMKELLSFQKDSVAVDAQKASYMKHLNNLQKQQCINSGLSSVVTDDRRKPPGFLPSLEGNVLDEEERKESLPICESSVFSGFQQRYQEQLNSRAEAEELKTWVEREVSLLKTTLSTLGADVYNPATFFTKLFDKNILLTHAGLHQKYATSNQTGAMLEEKAIEYQMQVLLQLEVAKLWTNCEYESIASELVHLLRDLSFMKNPGFMGRYMKEIILPSYNVCCQKLLVDVFEGLMLPLPASLCCSGLVTDESHMTMVSTPSTCPPLSVISQEDSQSSCITTQQPQDDSVSLVRRNSFSGFYHQQRRISIASKRRKSQAKVTENDACQSENGEQEISVKRTLFNRSHTVSEFGRDKIEKARTSKKCKKGSPTFEKFRDIIVKETPRKKQVENYRKFKLQRHRSRAEGPDLPDISVIEESPKRSFYSTNKVSRQSGDLCSPEQLPQQQSPNCCSSDEILGQSSSMQKMDSGIEHETASMMAFALCTPTKDDPRTFSGLV